MLLNKLSLAEKTKATPKDRQWHRTKPIQNSRYQAGGLGKILRPQIEAGECRQLATVGRTKKCTLAGYQPFGSMPRCCNSLRSMRFIQVANDESPSLRVSSSSWARKSSGSRIWYCGDFFNSCIDTCNYPNYYLKVITRVVTFELKGNAPKCSRTPRRLTTAVNVNNEAAMKNHITQSQIVYLPYVSAVNPEYSDAIQLVQQSELYLLERVKNALDEAGVAWVDTRTKERSKPADTDASQIPPYGEVENDDSEEGCEDIRYAIRQHLYHGDTLTRTFYNSRVFICKNAAQEYAEQFSHEFKTGQFTTQSEVTELTPQIVNEIRSEYGWNNPTTVYRALPDNWREDSDNAQ